MADSVALPVEIKYEKVPSVAPKYKYLKVPLNNIPGGSVGPMTAAQTQQLEFMLGPNVYNLAKSYISYKTSIAAQGVVPNRYSVLFADTQTLADQLSFSDAAGNNLLNIQSADKYVKVMRKVDTPREEYVTHTLLDRLAPSGLDATANYQPTAMDTTAFDAVTYYPGAASNANYRGVFEPLNAPMQVYVSAADTILNIRTKLPLSAFVNTILSEDKDLYFGQNMYLRMTTPAVDRMCFQTTNVATFAAPTTIAGGITLSDIYLYLAIEQSTLIRNSIMDKFNRGELKLPIQVIYPYRISPGAATSTSITWNLTKDMGRKLKWITHTCWLQADTLADAFNCVNVNGTKISSYQTFLNGQPLQNQALICAQPLAGAQALEDYSNNLDVIEGSVLSNAGDYQMNWFHRDNFSRVNIPDEVSDENIDDGLDMGEYQQQLQWGIQATTAATQFNHISWACFKRSIAVRPDGITWLD